MFILFYIKVVIFLERHAGVPGTQPKWWTRMDHVRALITDFIRLAIISKRSWQPKILLLHTVDITIWASLRWAEPVELYHSIGCVVSDSSHGTLSILRTSQYWEGALLLVQVEEKRTDCDHSDRWVGCECMLSIVHHSKCFTNIILESVYIVNRKVKLNKHILAAYI